MLGTGRGSATEGRRNVERIRAGAEAQSPALEAQGDPVLDYLLGGDGVRRRRGGTAALTASPVLVGAVTLLVTIVAVFLSYNANSGLPFVPPTT